jgi:ribosomal protein S18 acetylase RimI-like enzyme
MTVAARTVRTAGELYRRGVATLVAAWEECAQGAAGAAVLRYSEVAVAVFPHGPERAVYNNALLAHGLTAGERSRALRAMEAAYAEAGVSRFAAWTHESDTGMRSDLERRGYRLEVATRAMGMELGDVLLPRPAIELAATDWSEHLRIVGVPPDFLSSANPDAFNVLIGRIDGENVATAGAFDHEGDTGIYDVGTLEHARRRGLATALVTLQVHDARDRGSDTASLQSTPMAERMYEAVGFRDLGRILEYMPPAEAA